MSDRYFKRCRGIIHINKCVYQSSYEIHAVRVICIQGQTQSQQLRYPKIIGQTKNDIVKRQQNLKPTIEIFKVYRLMLDCIPYYMLPHVVHATVRWYSYEQAW